MRAAPAPDLDGAPGEPGGRAGPGGARPAEDEAALVTRVLAGDHEALGPLVAPYVGSLRRVSRAILGDVDEADDAAQDAVLLALVKLDQFDRSRRFGPWLMRIVTNAAIDRQRRRRVRVAGGLDDDVAGDDPLPDAEAERVVLGERLEAALAQLPERYRTAVVLFDVEGYSHAEIAELLDVAPGTVRSAVFHARRRLRGLLADWREGEARET